MKMCFQSKDFDSDWRYLMVQYFVVKVEKMDSNDTSKMCGEVKIGDEFSSVT